MEHADTSDKDTNIVRLRDSLRKVIRPRNAPVSIEEVVEYDNPLAELGIRSLVISTTFSFMSAAWELGRASIE